MTVPEDASNKWTEEFEKQIITPHISKNYTWTMFGLAIDHTANHNQFLSKFWWN